MKHIYYNKRGSSYANSGEFDKAISFYEKAISIKSNYAEAYYNLGYSFHKLGQLDKAVRSYKKVVEIKPDYAETHSNNICFYAFIFLKVKFQMH